MDKYFDPYDAYEWQGPGKWGRGACFVFFEGVEAPVEGEAPGVTIRFYWDDPGAGLPGYTVIGTPSREGDVITMTTSSGDAWVFRPLSVSTWEEIRKDPVTFAVREDLVEYLMNTYLPTCFHKPKE